jgi:hypothetical protein
MRMDVAACKRWWQRRRITALKPSGLDLVPGIRLRVIDANLQGWKAALQFDGTGFGTFSGVEFGLDSSVDFKDKPGFRKFVGAKCHVDGCPALH